MNLWNNILRLLYKPFCVGCGKAGDWLCNKCELKIRVSLPECYVCRHISNGWRTDKQCLSRETPFNRFFIAWEYGKEGRKLLAVYKYRGVYRISSFLSRLLLGSLEGFINNLLKEYRKDEIILTVIPLHKRREKSRGFNQSALVAKNIADILGLRFISQLLKRTKDTVKQSKLSKVERRKNIKSAFRVSKSVEVDEKIKVIILFDDVLTTGSTMNEAGRVLSTKYPDKEIIGVAMFRGSRPIKRIN